ncbi:hypothetical protein SCP_0303970 [Sparassis crispa]|uniref:Uncharacterized protein n=1 Tax=Sparassis crispa TaxID=139825 RepID=A0A401GES3_9APHY|nr:hypothetical protein SCP_0303970 [Sparassis crispa]GBE80678.1 hypothetical protein SCP_0303970 [Sparassis crispa]
MGRHAPEDGRDIVQTGPTHTYACVQPRWRYMRTEESGTARSVPSPFERRRSHSEPPSLPSSALTLDGFTAAPHTRIAQWHDDAQRTVHNAQSGISPGPGHASLIHASIATRTARSAGSRRPPYRTPAAARYKAARLRIASARVGPLGLRQMRVRGKEMPQSAAIHPCAPPRRSALRAPPSGRQHGVRWVQWEI